MERMNSFGKFSKIYENEEIKNNVEEKEELAQSEKEASQEIDKLANPQNSSIVDKIKSSVEDLQSAPQTLKENIDADKMQSMATNDSEWNEAMNSILKKLVPRLPKLVPGSPLAKRVLRDRDGEKFFGMTDIQAEYYPVDYTINNFGGIGIKYKEKKYNRPDLYPDLQVSYQTDKDSVEVEHLFSIFEELSKKEKVIKFINKSAGVVGSTLQVIGGLAVAACFLYFFGELVRGNPNYSQGAGGYEGYPSMDMTGVFPHAGLFGLIGAGGGLAASLGSLIKSMNTGKEFDIRKRISSFVSILKAHLEPVGLQVTDLKTIADINAVLQNTGEIANVTKPGYTNPSAKMESLSTKKIKGFNKFK